MSQPKVYVVMSNDYPDAVFSSETSAKAYCFDKRKEDEGRLGRIYWAVYEFDVRQEHANA